MANTGVGAEVAIGGLAAAGGGAADAGAWALAVPMAHSAIRASSACWRGRVPTERGPSNPRFIFVPAAQSPVERPFSHRSERLVTRGRASLALVAGLDALFAQHRKQERIPGIGQRQAVEVEELGNVIRPYQLATQPGKARFALAQVQHFAGAHHLDMPIAHEH